MTASASSREAGRPADAFASDMHEPNGRGGCDRPPIVSIRRKLGWQARYHTRYLARHRFRMGRRRAEQQLSLFDQPGLSWSHVSGLSLRVRESARAKRLILQVMPPGSLEVVVPLGTRAAEVEAFVAANGHWIESARRRLGLSRERAPIEPPSGIVLAATGQRLAIDYLSGADRVRTVAGDRLEVRHSEQGPAVVFRLLRNWLLDHGRRVLKPWLASESHRLGLMPKGIQVRLQRTRWGSCSSRGNISLNAALLLVPPELVRYLFVHELCHLKHLNHSRRYWARVRQFEPEYEALDSRLAEEWKRLPAWLFDSGCL